MRARPGLVSAALILLAIIHAYWGARVLLGGAIFFAGSQIVSAGGFLLAGVGTRHRTTLATGLTIAALATLARVPMMLDPPGPFAATVALLASGIGLAAWGAHTLSDRPRNTATIALRGGFALMAAGYAGIALLSAVFGGNPIDLTDLALRTLAATTCATFIDAPPITGPTKRKAFPDADPMRSP